MSSKYLSGTYASGYSLSGVYTSVTVGSNGSIGGTGLVGGTHASYTVLNLGRIAASASLASGIELKAGGSVANGSSGNAGAYIGGAAGAAGAPGQAGGPGGVGISLAGGGDIANYGTIRGGAGGYGADGGVGVSLAGGGNVTNSGTITGGTGGGNGGAGMVLSSGGEVFNSGVIGGGHMGYRGIPGAGVVLYGGGSIVNHGTITGGGYRSRIGAGFGVDFAGTDGATLTNYGTIFGVRFGGAGDVLVVEAGSRINFAAQGCGGTLELANGVGAGRLSGLGSRYVGFSQIAVLAGSNWTLTGKNEVANGVTLSTGSGATLISKGTLDNAGSMIINRVKLSGHFYNTGSVSGPVVITGGTGTMTNLGTISATGTYGHGAGVLVASDGRVTNGSLLSGTASGIQVGAIATGMTTVTNYGTIVALGGTGVLFEGAFNNTLTNSGTITGADGTAVVFGRGDDLLIVGPGAVFDGIVNGGGGVNEIDFEKAGTVTLAPEYVGFSAVRLADGGADSLTLTLADLTGLASGATLTIYCGNDGTTVDARALPAANAAIIVGGSGPDVLTGGAGNDVFEFAAADLTNSDVISGGSGTNELLMTSAGAIEAARVSGVEIYRLADGGANSLTLTAANFAGVAGGAITVDGGNDGNSVDASSLRVADRVVLVGGTGTDVFKGGAGNDVFEFTAADLTDADLVQGGGGRNELLMTSAGVIHASGVSGIETYVLASGGANTLIVTLANFTGVAGAAITIEDGNSGNTVNGAALPVQDHIVVHAGTGIDSLIGGAGNDIFFAGGRTTMTGGVGANEFTFDAAGRNSVTDFRARNGDKLVFSNSGFRLELPGATQHPKKLPSYLFVANKTGTFITTRQRFAYDTTNGRLFYDSSGSADPSARHLVVTLENHATLSVGDLFFIR
jgi:Ca2+-binding RTX toxin-like protein